jgi:hypothetical protein
MDGRDRQVDVPMEGIEADCYGEALEPAYDVQWVPVGIEKNSRSLRREVRSGP